MKTIRIAAGLLLAGLAPASAAETAAAGSGVPAMMSVRQELIQALTKQGFTDISVAPTSFLVRARDASGRPVVMAVGPDSVTEVTGLAAAGGAAPGAAVQGAAVQGGIEKPASTGEIAAFLKEYGSDGTLSLPQATKAGDAHFDVLDKKHDGKVTRRELTSAGVSKQDFDANNPDKDATLEKDEYENLVKEKYGLADPKHGGRLTEAELATPAGEALLRLLR